jgi:hypothetical protein
MPRSQRPWTCLSATTAACKRRVDLVQHLPSQNNIESCAYSTPVPCKKRLSCQIKMCSAFSVGLPPMSLFFQLCTTSARANSARRLPSLRRAAIQRRLRKPRARLYKEALILSDPLISRLYAFSGFNRGTRSLNVGRPIDLSLNPLSLSFVHASGIVVFA